MGVLHPVPLTLVDRDQLIGELLHLLLQAVQEQTGADVPSHETKHHLHDDTGEPQQRPSDAMIINHK